MPENAEIGSNLIFLSKNSGKIKICTGMALPASVF